MTSFLMLLFMSLSQGELLSTRQGVCDPNMAWGAKTLIYSENTDKEMFMKLQHVSQAQPRVPIQMLIVIKSSFTTVEILVLSFESPMIYKMSLFHRYKQALCRFAVLSRCCVIVVWHAHWSIKSGGIVAF